MENKTLAQRLRMARAYRGWTQTYLSQRSGVHKMQISKLERGTIKDTSTGTLRALCEALGVSPGYLLGMTDDMGVSDVDEEESLSRTATPVG
jgi:transcriptional regulator with XRE-family HTH domain